MSKLQIFSYVAHLFPLVYSNYWHNMQAKLVLDRHIHDARYFNHYLAFFIRYITLDCPTNIYYCKKEKDGIKIKAIEAFI